MLVIQTSILDLIATCLRDIKRLNSFVSSLNKVDGDDIIKGQNGICDYSPRS